jgi:hypothetical protein
MDFTQLKWSFKTQRGKQRIIDKTHQLLQNWPETAGLLDLADKHNVAIVFNENLLGTETDGQFCRNPKTGAASIELKPYTDPRDLAVPLIHELRHLWQAEQMGTVQPGKAEDALFLTRIKEADAFAFTNLMISRLNNAGADSRETKAFEKRLRHDNSALSEAAISEQAQDFWSERIAGRVEAERKKMTEDFLKALTWLDSYDRETLGVYYRRHAASDTPVPATDPVAMARRVLKTGVMPGMPPYLDELDDKSLVAAVTKGIDPEVGNVAALVTAFEKATRPSAEARSDLEKELRQVSGAPPRHRFSTETAIKP